MGVQWDNKSACHFFKNSHSRNAHNVKFLLHVAKMLSESYFCSVNTEYNIYLKTDFDLQVKCSPH
jgi:hypothetical protein